MSLRLIKNFTIIPCLVFISIVQVSAQSLPESINSTGTVVSQNFNTMGNSATASLPQGWKLGTDWTAGVQVVSRSGGTSGTGILNGTSAGGFYNFANGVNATSTDRSIGFLSSGTYASPRSIIYAFTNNTGSAVSSISLDWNNEKYRSGSRAFNWTFYHGNTSSATTASTEGDYGFVADANNTTVYNPPTSFSKSITLNGLNIQNGETYYLRWTYTGVGGSTNGQALGIDDFNITLNPALLPIELIAFNASCNSANSAKISWTTASEYNTSHYEVEKSSDGFLWNTIGKIAAAGYSNEVLNYEFIDNSKQLGTNYYRLTQYDNDGMFEQFGPVATDCKNEPSTTTLSTYPNPSEGSFYISLFTEEMEGAGVITITDAKGALVHTKDVTIQKGNTIFHMDNLNIAPGMYYIQVTNGKVFSPALIQCLE
jgi:hypothetical protein